MSESAARGKKLSAVASERESLTRELDTRKGVLSSLHEELKSATGTDKNRLMWMIRNQSAAVEQAQKNLEAFETPVIIPQLKIARLEIGFHPDNARFDATVWVNNPGILPSLGSFEIGLSVAYYTYDQDPPLYVDEAADLTTPDSTDVQPGGTNPFVIGSFPFVTKPGSASALYTFDVLLVAGPNGVVADQTLHLEFNLQPPRFHRPIVPLGGVLSSAV
jgi:hypothetical protein